MRPIEFAQQTDVIAKDQPQYQPLPVFYGPGPDFEAISCWKLTWRERFKLLFSGILWNRQMTWGHPFQPVVLEVEHPWPPSAPAKRLTRSITINGVPVHWAHNTMSYVKLCEMLSIKPESNPSVIFKSKDGRTGTLIHGQEIAVTEGMHFEAMHTGNA